ncbi:MAG: nucleotide sugar dehydrogenase [Bacteroidetes bacterium]|nr:nucleotide sugar dehydrogenase [Bacteroidota bacterium]
MSDKPLNRFLDRFDSIAVIGLGYTGLPLALRLAERFSVIGYDSDPVRIQQLQEGYDSNHELELGQFPDLLPVFTSDLLQLTHASVYIIAVPTPVDKNNLPDLRFLKEAVEQIGKFLKNGDCVVVESTVYPGCTEEFCAPLLEKISGLQLDKDFSMGYSPERISPGDAVHHIGAVIKLVAASDPVTLRFLTQLYQQVTMAGVHACVSIRVAEAAKLTENIQRDVNIALLNELSSVYETLGIDPGAVWEAAATKWNFLPFRPGLAGGHCISVDPYYLINAIKEQGGKASLVEESRRINEGMVARIAAQVFQHFQSTIIGNDKKRVLVLGASFKPDVRDFRNSKPVALTKLLMRNNIEVELVDPLVDGQHLEKVSGLRLTSQPTGYYQVMIIAVNHTVFKELEESYFCNCTSDTSLVIDLTGEYKRVISNRKYWTI